MSAELLQRLKGHIIDTGGLLASYSLRYYRWLDSDISGSGSVVLFRMSGSSGSVDSEVQFPDVMIQLLTNRDEVTQADADMLDVVQYLRANYKSADAFLFTPIGTFTGPNYLDNGRAMFETIIRCGVSDH